MQQPSLPVEEWVDFGSGILLRSLNTHPNLDTVSIHISLDEEACRNLHNLFRVRSVETPIPLWELNHNLRDPHIRLTWRPIARMLDVTFEAGPVLNIGSSYHSREFDGDLLIKNLDTHLSVVSDHLPSTSQALVYKADVFRDFVAEELLALSLLLYVRAIPVTDKRLIVELDKQKEEVVYLANDKRTGFAAYFEVKNEVPKLRFESRYRESAVLYRCTDRERTCGTTSTFLLGQFIRNEELHRRMFEHQLARANIPRSATVIPSSNEVIRHRLLARSGVWGSTKEKLIRFLKQTPVQALEQFPPGIIRSMRDQFFEAFGSYPPSALRMGPS